MSPIFYGFLAGMIMGLVAAGVVVYLLAGPEVEYHQLTIEGRDVECIVWHETISCQPQAASLYHPVQ